MIVLTLAPGWWILVASVTKGDAFFNAAVPGDVTLDNYRAVLNDSDFKNWIKNSVIVCTAVAASRRSRALAAYAFSRLRFWGRRYGLMGMLIIQMFPSASRRPRYFYALFRLGEWTGARSARHPPRVDPRARGRRRLRLAVQGLPGQHAAELEEAAFVDGASRLKTGTCCSRSSGR